METPYIYFETHEVVGSNPEPRKMQNENFLVNKPHTNSTGVWGFRNFTERKGFQLPTYVIVNQYWIDLNKFTDTGDKEVNALLKEFFSKMRDPREEAIKEILNEIFEEESNGEEVNNVKILKNEDSTFIDFDVYDGHREGTFSNQLKVHEDGSVTCWDLHPIWEGGDVDSSIEKRLTEFWKKNVTAGS